MASTGIEEALQEVEWVDGRLQTADWLMELDDDPLANRIAAEVTIEHAVERHGFSEEEAHRLFGKAS